MENPNPSTQHPHPTESDKEKLNAPLIKEPTDSGESGPQFDKKKIFLGLQKHLLLIFTSMAAFGALGVYVCYTLQTTYEAEAIVLYQQEEETSKNLQGGFTLSNLSLPTVLDMITLPNHFEKIKQTLGLDLPSSQIQGLVYVPKPKNNSNFIHIVAKTKSAQLSVDIANALAKISVKSSQDFTKRQLKQALDGYQNQLSLIRQAESIQNDELEKFKSDNSYFDMKPEDTSFLARVEDARKMREKANLEYRSLLIQYENLKKQIDSVPKYNSTSSRSTDNPLKMRILSLQTALAESRAKYTKNNPKILQLEHELNSLINHSKENSEPSDSNELYGTNELRDKLEIELVHLQGKVKSARKVKEDLQKTADKLELELQQFPAQQMAFVKLLQSSDITIDRLKEANKAVDAAKLMINDPKGSIELYQLASKAKLEGDSLWVDFIPFLGMILGFGIGVVGALLLEINDKKIRTAKQIDLFYHTPCIGSIPELRGLKKSNAQAKLMFFVRNFVDHIDKKLTKKKINNHAVIAITSSLNNEGKSLLATLTAEYYAQLDKKVILVEMDYHNNSFAEPTYPSQKTITDYLTGNSSMDEIIHPGKYDCVISSKREPGMKELLKSRAADNFWKHLRSKYEIIIIDTPGIIEEDYASNLAEISDMTVLVVGSSVVTKNIVDEALCILKHSHSKICGILLNRIDEIYISDKRLLLETKRSKGSLLTNLLFWR